MFHLLPTGSSNAGHPPLLCKPALQRRVLQSPTPDDIAVRGQVFFLVESGCSWHTIAGFNPPHMSHEPRLTQALRALFDTQRVAALGTLDDHAQPFVSMVPYAVEPHAAQVVIHVSALAAHRKSVV